LEINRSRHQKSVNRLTGGHTAAALDEPNKVTASRRWLAVTSGARASP
jgi:hypothetical protein